MLKAVIYMSLIGAYSIALPFVGSIVSLIKRKKYFLTFNIYIFFMMIVQSGMLFFAYNKINNIWLIHLFLPFEFIALSMLLINWIKTTKKVYLIIGFGISLSLILVDELLLTNLFVYAEFSLLIESLSLLFLSIAFLIEQKNESNNKILIAFGILFYTGVTAFLSPVFADIDILQRYLIYAVLNIVTNIIFAIGLLWD